MMRMLFVERTTPPISLGILISSISTAFTDTDYGILIIYLGLACTLLLTSWNYSSMFLVSLAIPAVFLYRHFDVTLAEASKMSLHISSEAIIYVALRSKAQIPRTLPHVKRLAILICCSVLLVGIDFIRAHPIYHRFWYFWILDAFLGNLVVYMTYFLLRKVDVQVTMAMMLLKKVILMCFDPQSDWIGFLDHMGFIFSILVVGIFLAMMVLVFEEDPHEPQPLAEEDTHELQPLADEDPHESQPLAEEDPHEQSPLVED
ncbi:hypothetical protein MLD38_036620 [Melastoma candidum]|uniref:Uncharacterized protein n=1 Tax=Melastoma candidum TaxID=119954 RepID=A0ACB9LK37_9MYRT|nr:hypothetical protein MLD38_036620 [Melastoma candidum]